MVGRVAIGFVVDRLDRRTVAAVNFAVQACAFGLLATTSKPAMLYLGCVLFGAGVGNATSLPGLIVQREFPKQHFARIISLVVAINQFSFAFGPLLLASLRSNENGYADALTLCLIMEIVAAGILLSPMATARIGVRLLRHRSATKKRRG